MALIKHQKNGQEITRARRPGDGLETFFSDWPDWSSLFRRPFVVVPELADVIRSDEFVEDGTLVVRIEIGGIDPGKDVDISLEGDVLHICAERREEEEAKERDYTRRELRYGSFRRDVLVPAGTTESDVKASYRDGILEVRVPVEIEPPATEVAKIEVTTT